MIVAAFWLTVIGYLLIVWLCHQKVPDPPPPPAPQIEPYIEPIVTYGEVARWLPMHVRESIEVTGRCMPSANGEHLWNNERRWWNCVYCGAASTYDPRPADSWARKADRHIQIYPVGR